MVRANIYHKTHISIKNILFWYTYGNTTCLNIVENVTWTILQQKVLGILDFDTFMEE